MDFKCSDEVIKDAKNIFDNCIDCKLCMKQCEMLNDYCSSPKDLFGRISESGTVDVNIPYFCSMCQKCKKVCPRELKLSEAFMEMRRDIVKKNGGKSPMKGHRAVENHQRFSFSKLFNISIEDTRAGYTKRAFIPGCGLSSYSPYLVGKTLEYLQERLPGTGAILMCCGKPTMDLGQDDKFMERYSRLQGELELLGVTEVITACQNCYKTIQENSPNIKVSSLWEVIPSIGLPRSKVEAYKDIVFSIHDACPTRDNSKIHDGVRWIIRELGYKVQESSDSREMTNCCGFGGMVFPVNPKLAKRVIKKSASIASSEYVITYCASCRQAMAMGGKKSVHILDLMFNNGGNSHLDLTKGIVKSWGNRYKTKCEIRRFNKQCNLGDFK